MNVIESINLYFKRWKMYRWPLQKVDILLTSALVIGIAMYPLGLVVRFCKVVKILWNYDLNEHHVDLFRHEL